LIEDESRRESVCGSIWTASSGVLAGKIELKGVSEASDTSVGCWLHVAHDHDNAFQEYRLSSNNFQFIQFPVMVSCI
jgi:hypothetical protein